MKAGLTHCVEWSPRGNRLCKRDVVLLEGGVLLLMAGGLVFSAVQAQVALLLIGIAVALYVLNAPLHHQLNVIFLVMMFDFQRPVGGTWVYLDLSFATLLLPLLRQRRLPPMWWVFTPYTLFLLVDGLPRALVPAWYAGFMIRSVLAVLMYVACSLADVEESYFTILGVTMVTLTLYGVYQLYIGDFGVLFAWMNPHMNMPWTGRAYSLLWQPNSYGGVCSIAIVSFAALRMKGIRVYLMTFFIGVTSVGLICSGSRGALIATFCGVSLAAWLCGKRRFIFVPILLIATVLALGSALQVTFLQRLAGGDRESNEGRALGNTLGIRSFLQNPIAGVGPTNFETILPSMHEWGYANPMPVNNIYLQHLAELGLVGFSSFWIPLGVLTWAAWKQRQDAIVLVGLCTLVTFAVHGLFDYLFEFGPPYLYLFYASCGLMAGRLVRLNHHSEYRKSAVLALQENHV